jgi:hypothetical protein
MYIEIIQKYSSETLLEFEEKVNMAVDRHINVDAEVKDVNIISFNNSLLAVIKWI